MKKNNIVLFGIAVLCACSVPKERQPLTGGQWGAVSYTHLTLPTIA